MAVATRGLTAKGVPPQPSWLLILKGVIIVLSLIILALAAYAISVVGSFYSYYYGTGAAGYMIFIVSPSGDDEFLRAIS